MIEVSGTRFLVTGGAGFIGSHICEELIKQDKHVVCMDNFVNGKLNNIRHLLDNSKFSLVVGDITKILEIPSLLDTFTNIDVVFHEACSKCTVCRIDPELDMRVNAWGSYNVFEAARLKGVKKVVHASTGSVYGEPHVFPETEDHPLNPCSFYGISKLAGEKYLAAFDEYYNLNYTILRYFHVYGSRQDNSEYGGVIPIFIRNILNQEPIKIYGDGTQQRSFTYVKDVVAANFVAANNPATDKETYHVASGIQVTITDLAEMIREVMGVPEHPIEYHDWRKGDIKNFDISNEKIRGVEPLLFTNTFKEGLRETIDWYVAERNGRDSLNI